MINTVVVSGAMVFLLSSFAQAMPFVKSYKVICNMAEAPVQLTFSEAVDPEILNCTKEGSNFVFRLKNDLQVKIGNGEYVANKNSAVFMNSKNSSQDKSCQSVYSNLRSVLFSVTPATIPGMKYNIGLDMDGNIYVSQMQVLVCGGKAE